MERMLTLFIQQNTFWSQHSGKGDDSLTSEVCPGADMVAKQWGLHLKPTKFEHICSCHNFSPLSSVQILLIPACCLLCVL